jgi:hypothetical protein
MVHRFFHAPPGAHAPAKPSSTTPRPQPGKAAGTPTWEELLGRR